MRTPWLLLMLLAVLIVAPALALPNSTAGGGAAIPGGEEVEANRRVVGKWHGDPEHYARLKNDLKQFRGLPPERQARMRQLDQELYQEDPATRAKLWNVMDRYVTWLGQLLPAERQKIEDAATPGERLPIIRQLRDKEWLERLPLAKRKELAGLPETDRPPLVQKFREEERDRRRRWDQALANQLEVKPPAKPGQPIRLNEFPLEVQVYVNTVLIPALSQEERKQLDDAEGKLWPEYGRQILALSEKHPPVLPGVVPRPTQPTDIPKPVRERLRQLMPTLLQSDREKLRPAVGKWPEYGMVVTEIIRKNGPMPKQLGPSRPNECGPIMHTFIEKLTAKLDDKQKQQLREAEGKWPEYPQAILDLANAHKMPVPGMRLPEPKDGFWDKVRAGN